MNKSEILARTSVCRLSSLTPAAIATIWISGPHAGEYVAKFWRGKKPVRQLKVDRIHYGDWHTEPLSDNNTNSASESVVVCRTAEETYEIHSHGGKMAAAQIVAALVESGAEELSAQEYFSAVGNGKITAQAQSVLLQLTTANAAKILLWQEQGALQQELQCILRLIRMKDVSSAIERLEALRQSGRWGCFLVNAPKVAICGLPNAGKSSLLNAILGYERAIVHQTPGTTRDILIEPISANGWPMDICDTAGLRMTDEEIESIGISSTLEIIKNSDVVVLLIATDQEWSNFHEQVAATCSGHLLLVRSKSDLPNNKIQLPDEMQWAFETAIRPDLADETRQCISTFLELLSSQIFPAALEKNLPVPFLPSQLGTIDSAFLSLRSIQTNPEQLDVAASTLDSLL